MRKPPTAEIEKLQKTYNLSFDDAVKLWEEDEGYRTNETVENLTKKAEKARITATIHQASATKERKPRERKENPLKKQIIEEIFYSLTRNLLDADCINIRNDEKYIDFSIDGQEFTINLIQHRNKK